MPWAEHAADRSPMVQRWRTRNMRQTRTVVEAAERLIAEKGGQWTTQELAKEAGVAVQTFYRHFGGKDQLLLAVLEDMIERQTAVYEATTSDLANPVERLRRFIVSALESVGGGSGSAAARFITAEHWRLLQLFPEEVSRATRPFVDMVARELDAARRAELLDPVDVEHDAEFLSKLVMSVFHHYAFVPTGETAEAIAARLWKFCLTGIGGRADATGGTCAAPAARRRAERAAARRLRPCGAAAEASPGRARPWCGAVRSTSIRLRRRFRCPSPGRVPRRSMPAEPRQTEHRAAAGGR
ncbi:TetR/AcrR family transcriptional regulator [Actinomadura sp. CNU-125]|uniref:TetR/AcrR family transcriptional regulator n=1 Tax=Actinomadura sp. CNU-125 TaxID=1904961 RepID=UPI0021CCA0EE|nr:TetR/AcrR family transcriptional regulator [Actinomadura sp. CNU-125]